MKRHVSIDTIVITGSISDQISHASQDRRFRNVPSVASSKNHFFKVPKAQIIQDYELKEQPDERFYEMLNQLRGMANNLNQMSRTYNRYQGYIKENKITLLLNQIQDLVLSMQEVYLIPKKKGALNGNNKNMEI